MCEIKEVLDKLSDIKPYKIKQAYSYKGLYQVSIIIYILFAAVALAYYFYPGKKLGYVLILLYLLVNLMGLLCMIAPAFLEIKHYLFRWKKVTLTELLEEIKHDENNAKSLSFFLNEQLNYTSYWILQKN
ncbi:Uncharacterised protein [Oligella ureolytica]|nr:hypothetical protein [Oligella ureolytica]QPT40302.1 hypothetical protein I6G29_01325 [Oligella ureolytica]SUA50647.1 Uncharacterised protein [Oligella ureolytica]